MQAGERSSGAAGDVADDGAGTPGAATAAAGAKPCAAPSKEVGVSDEEITLGSISTLSGAVPGLGANSLAAARAYVAYRNSTGGVCGRKLVLKTADDGMDNGRYRAPANDMWSQVVGFVGGVGGGDASGADVVEAKKLPVVNTPISEVFQNVSTVDLVMGLCSRVCVLNLGQVIASGTPTEVRGDAAVQEAYLGAAV